MSRHTEQIVLQEELGQVLEACQLTIAQMGWRVLSQANNSIKLKEVSPQSTSFTHAVEIEVQLAQSPEGTVVRILGRIPGFGPIQSGHLKGQVGSFVNRLNVCLQQVRQQHSQTSSNDLPSELEKVADLHKSGALTDGEYALAKQRLLNR